MTTLSYDSNSNTVEAQAKAAAAADAAAKAAQQKDDEEVDKELKRVIEETLRDLKNKDPLRQNKSTCSITKGPLRDRLGNPPSNLKNHQAQHDLPQAPDLQKQWNRVGLDNDDPQYGRWVEGNPPGTHQSWSYQFNQEWRNFFENNEYATKDQILQEMNKLRNDPRFQ